MKQLNRTLLNELDGRLIDLPDSRMLALPEKVLQFGTGVLLRGLPDDLINTANQSGAFNGRIVMVKSTGGGYDSALYERQDMLYTHCVRGMRNGRMVDTASINASISRVLPAGRRWPEVLACAENPDIRIIISNTTEAGLRLTADDNPWDTPPVSFPAKLLAVLNRRYQSRGGGRAEGLVILPTELVDEPGHTLRDLVLRLARRLNMAPDFIDWIPRANHFCNTLVDRIVPGKLPNDQHRQVEHRLGYRDPLMILSEPYGLWAIEAEAPAVLETLTFAAANPGLVVAPDINRYREIKLRLLNGTHSFACGLAILSGFVTVREAMADQGFVRFVERLMVEEIVPSLPAGLKKEALAFADAVFERFQNPFLEHAWQKIAVQYSEKVKARNIPVIMRQREVSASRSPERMALGFAAFLLFTRCSAHGDGYLGGGRGRSWPVEDERAAWFSGVWHKSSPSEAVDGILAEESLWGTDLTAWPAFADRVKSYLLQLLERDAASVIAEVNAQEEQNSKPAEVA